MTWFVYVLVSDSLGTTYVGATTEVDRRCAQHNGDRPGGARSTRRGRPWRIGATSPPLASLSAALKLERAIKRERGLARITAMHAHVAD